MSESNVKPWDLLNPNTKRSEDKVSSERLGICKLCPKLIKLTKQCKECGCIMSFKTKLELATCPLGKW